MKRVILGLLGMVLVGAVITVLLIGFTDRPLEVRGAWARPAAAGNNSAVYFIIDNGTRVDDNLLGAACDAAMMTEVHQTFTDADGNSRMEEQEQVPVGGRTAIDFQPGGLHVMLMNLKQDLKPGDRLTLQLTFEQAGTVEVQAEVRQP